MSSTTVQNSNLLFSGVPGQMFIKANGQNNLYLNGIGGIQVQSSGVPTVNVINPATAGNNGTIVGNDFGGQIQFQTGANNLAANICSVTFSSPKTTTPLVFISGNECTGLSASSSYLMSNSVTTGSFAVYDNGIAPTTSSFSFNYMVLQNYQ